MKRRLLPLAALLCAAVLCMTMAFAAESYTISIDVPAGTLHTGDSFTAGITLHGRAGESAPSTLQVDVIYAGCVCTDAAVTVPGVTTRMTSRFTSPFASFGSSICSATATL